MWERVILEDAELFPLGDKGLPGKTESLNAFSHISSLKTTRPHESETEENKENTPNLSTHIHKHAYTHTHDSIKQGGCE